MKKYLLAILSAICLGTLGVTIKLIGTEIPIMTINFFRVFIAFLFLLLIVPKIDKNTFKVTKKDLKEYFFVGLLLAISFSLYGYAYFVAPVQNIVLINSFSPFFVLIFAYFLLKEKITIKKIITLIIALLGLIIINPFNFENQFFFGNMLALINSIIIALLITEMRKEDKIHSIGDVLWFFFFALIILLPVPFIYGLGNLMNQLPLILFLGLVSGGLSYLLFNLALEKIEAEEASMIETIITPMISIILAIIILNEFLNFRIILGGIILISAGIYLEYHRKKNESGFI
jgi:drug/metabolite transporter (DMT)-like permease